MTSFRKIRVVVYLVLLFAAGTALGLGWSQMRRPAWTQSPEWAQRWLQRRMQSDFETIQATPEQQAKLKPSYDRLLSDFNAIQQESAQKVTDAFKRHGLDMWKQLTPEQREIIRQTNQERLNRKAAQP